jgi:hypothetical protein
MLPIRLIATVTTASPARTKLKQLTCTASITLGLLAASATAWAVPVTWYLSNVVTTTGKKITGSFVYDADTNTYSAINLASGPNTYTQTSFAGSGPSIMAANQAPAGLGQAGVGLSTTAPITNAGGVLNLRTGANQGGLLTCSDAACTAFSLGADTRLASGTITTTPPATAPASVPTLGEWALMLLVVLMGWVGMGGLRRVSAHRRPW